METPIVYTDQDVLKILRIKNVKVLRVLIGEGRLQCTKVGRFYRYTEKHINDFLNSKDS